MGKPTLISLFTGAGGLDLGLEQAGFQTLFANEIEPYACESLRSNRALRSLRGNQFEDWFQNHVLSQRCYKNISEEDLLALKSRLMPALIENKTYFNHSQISECDIRNIKSEDIFFSIGKKRGEIDLIAGGPPCQSFSRAGKREMVDCDTGQLFMEFVRLVDEIRPRWFIFENVKGLIINKADIAIQKCTRCETISTSDFKDRYYLKDASIYKTFCKKCGRLETHAISWEKRKTGSLDIIQGEFSRLGYSCKSRVLNAADYGAPQSRERLFIVGSRDKEHFKWPNPTHSDEKNLSHRVLTIFDGSQKKPWVTLREALYNDGHWKYGVLDAYKAVLWVKNVVRPHAERVTWSLDRPSPTIGAHQSAKLAIAPFGVSDEQLERQQWHVRGKRQGDTAPVFVEHEYLTDKELLILQTFPTSWYLHGTRMQRAFQIGNAVPPALSRAVGHSVIQAMSLTDEEFPPIEQEATYAEYYASSI